LISKICLQFCDAAYALAFACTARLIRLEALLLQWVVLAPSTSLETKLSYFICGASSSAYSLTAFIDLGTHKSAFASLQLNDSSALLAFPKTTVQPCFSKATLNAAATAASGRSLGYILSQHGRRCASRIRCVLASTINHFLQRFYKQYSDWYDDQRLCDCSHSHANDCDTFRLCFSAMESNK
jgi:hypothetical protein